MRKYNTQEVIEILQKNNYAWKLIDMVRPAHRHGWYFKPSFPSRGKGYKNYFTEDDVRKLKELFEAKTHLEKLLERYCIKRDLE